MAGIGFELKKLMQKEGVFARARAYGYAGIVCAGPMLLGVLLVLGLMFLCRLTGAARAEKELLVCMITYTLLASLIVTSFFSMPVTRFLADMLYEKREETILPSFWGSSSVMMLAGGVLYALFLAFSGVSLGQKILAFVLFEELVVVWNAMNYLTAIKDYQGILKVSASAVLITFAAGYALARAGIPQVEALLMAAVAGYGWMMSWYVLLLRRCFQKKGDFGGSFRFLQWMDEYFPLVLTGAFMNLGLFSHMIILWFTASGQQVKGLFYGAPVYDVPAFIAFLTTLITMINFVVSVEVNFYPKYRIYYELFNNKGTVTDIQQAEKEMLMVLDSELKYTALQQLLATIFSLSAIGIVLRFLPLGFNDMMLGYFRTLCVGYGIYAVGNTMLLLLLYFADYRGAVVSAAVFFAATTAFTLISLLFREIYLGFGFLLGCAVFFAAAYWRLNTYTRQLPYHILSAQPIVVEKKSGFFTKLERFLQKGGISRNES